MRICLLCYRGNPYSGGQGIYLKYIADEMVRQGHEVHVIVGPPYPHTIEGVILHKIPNNEYYIKKGISVINKKNPFSIFNPINFYEFLHTRIGAFSEISSFTYRAYMLLRKLHKEYNFDVIHDNQSLGYGLLLMKTLGVPVIATIHHPLSIDLENALERGSSFLNKVKAVMFYPLLMQAFVSKRIDHIITVSEDSKEAINRDFGVSMDKQTVVYNGIDRNVFHPAEGVNKKEGKIIFVGNIEDGKKGFIYLLKAMMKIKEDVKLTVVDGGAPHRKVTDKMMKNLKLGDKIEFTGKATVQDLVKHYSESEIAIVPSVYEGFGLPAAEAMSCGVPVVSSNGGALPEVVGNAGIIVPSRDPDAIAMAIDELITRKNDLKDMSQIGIERVSSFFNWENAVKQIVEVYKKFVK